MSSICFHVFHDPTDQTAVGAGESGDEFSVCPFGNGLARGSQGDSSPFFVWRNGLGLWYTFLPRTGVNIIPPSNPSSPSFIVTPRGEVIPIPSGATGPIPAASGKGFQFVGGTGGGPGLAPAVTTVRIMGATVPKGPSPGYPGGYVSYSHIMGQTVHPTSGKPVSRSDPSWHIPLVP